VDRSIQKNGLINLLALLAVGVAGFGAARYAHSLAGQVSAFYLGLGVLVAAASWFQMRLEERERLEKLELDELAKTKSSSTLFEAKDAEIFPAQRSRAQFERYFIPVFTVILFLLQGGGAYWLWRWLAPKPTAGVTNPMVALALFGLFALVLFLLGKFSATLARLEDNRLLRPGAGYLLLGAYLCFVVALGIAGVQAGWPKTDFIIARVLAAVLAVVAVETLITLLLEIYRPRVKGRTVRPIYESRLVGLLGQPEGLITTAAQALDYQFGFKVSETWCYRFLEKAFAWLLLLQAGVLLLSTCFVVIETGEQALLERFGRPLGEGVVGPGLHLKLPWPIDRAYRYRTEQVQSFVVGIAPEEEKEHGKITLWTVGHGKEENFLVASREQRGASSSLERASPDGATGKRSPPVSLLVVGIPVQYQITNLTAWAYNNEKPNQLLERIATREVVKYLVSADLQEIMAPSRREAAQALRERIQRAAEERKLGVHIVFAGLEDIHPPVNVAPEYEKVVSAIQQKEAKVLAARADAIRANALAGAQAVKIVNDAEADRQRREVTALAQAALFTNQIPAFQAAPSVYAQRTYLQTFVRAVAGARKYLVLTTNTQDVLTFDLQDKIRADLLEGLTVPPPKTK